MAETIDLGSLFPALSINAMSKFVGVKSDGSLGAVAATRFIASRSSLNDFNLMTKQGVYEVNGVMANGWQKSDLSYYGRVLVLGVTELYVSQIFFANSNTPTVLFRSCSNGKFSSWQQFGSFIEIKPPESTGGGKSLSFNVFRFGLAA